MRLDVEHLAIAVIKDFSVRSHGLMTPNVGGPYSLGKALQISLRYPAPYLCAGLSLPELNGRMGVMRSYFDVFAINRTDLNPSPINFWWRVNGAKRALGRLRGNCFTLSLVIDLNIGSSDA